MLYEKLYIVPTRDKEGQWWWGNKKVTMIVLPESEKDKYISKMKKSVSV